MNNLTTLIKRLEAATSRLEDMAQPSEHPTDLQNGTVPGPTAPPRAVQPAAGTPRTGDSQDLVEPLPVSIEDFDEMINGEITTFVNLSDELGGVVSEQSSAVVRAFGAQRKILIIATRAKKPDVQSPLYMEILTELQTEMGIVSDIREANRASPLFNHLSAVSEGIQAMAWITIDPKPADYVGEVLGGAQLFGNRVLKEYKDKEKKHVEWVQAFYQIFKSLVAYVKKHFPRGLVWNNKDGIDAGAAMQQMQSGQNSAKSTPVPQAGGVGAPPPPPPPLPNFENAPPPPPAPKSSGGASGGDMDAVFAALNKGEGVTSGLKKVDKSEMTHKNPSLRTTSAVPTRSDSQNSISSRGKSPAPPGKKPKPENMRTKKPPRKELDGNKWIIENYDNEPNPIQINASINQSVLISRCNRTTIQVTGKGNAISIDNSPRLSLLIDSLVSSVDVIKSPSFALQVLGSLPTVLLDQVDGATLYLSPESLGTEVFSSKCTNVNLNLPPEAKGKAAGDDADYEECPLPEQIKSVVKNGKVVSEIVEHAG
ncbi:MAG: hypothetical protein M4579_000690 [Chaenotheca gracillima]|nr:MAG: hypothetical protein M4579_000690 [Chaenotheca gracillima]